MMSKVSTPDLCPKDLNMNLCFFDGFDDDDSFHASPSSSPLQSITESVYRQYVSIW